MNNKEPSHALKGRTFFFIVFAKKLIIQTEIEFSIIDTHLLQ